MKRRMLRNYGAKLTLPAAVESHGGTNLVKNMMVVETWRNQAEVEVVSVLR